MQVPPAERGAFAVPSCPATSGADHPHAGVSFGWLTEMLYGLLASQIGLGSSARYTGTSGVVPRIGLDAAIA